MTATLETPRAEAAVVGVAVLVAPPDAVRLLREVFLSLQGSFPGAIVILAHHGPGRERGIADNLNVAPSVMVHQAAPGMRLRNGHAYVVPADAGLVIGADGCLTSARGRGASDVAPLLGDGEDPGSGQGLTFLASLAARYGGTALAVALTALDESEREGFARVRAAGGQTLALDEADRLWADSSGPRVVPHLEDETLSTALMGPRMISMANAF